MADVAKSLQQLRDWAASAPAGTLIVASELARVLEGAVEAAPADRLATAAPEPPTWRERLWTCHADVRLGVNELCEALDRPESWVYRHTSPASGLARLPHRKLDNALVFTAGEIRTWIQRNETIVVPGPRQALQFKRTA